MLSAKGQLISKHFQGLSIFSKKWRKTSRHTSKMNSFFRFLEEIDDPN